MRNALVTIIVALLTETNRSAKKYTYHKCEKLSKKKQTTAFCSHRFKLTT